MSNSPFQPTQISIRFFVEDYVEVPEPEVRKEISHIRSGIADASGTNVDIDISTASFEGKTYIDGFDLSTDMATITLFIINELKESIDDGLDVDMSDSDVIVSAEPIGFIRSKRPRVEYALVMAEDNMSGALEGNYINFGESATLKELKKDAIVEDYNSARLYPVASTDSIEDSITKFIYLYLNR